MPSDKALPTKADGVYRETSKRPNPAKLGNNGEMKCSAFF